MTYHVRPNFMPGLLALAAIVGCVAGMLLMFVAYQPLVCS